MDTSSLKLNDFESFENFLFSEEERKLPEDEKWAKYIITKNIGGTNKSYFVAPIPLSKLGRIEEYQLCHYTYWTCIGIFNSPIKMDFWNANDTKPLGKCYACAYGRTYSSTCNACINCPLQNHIHDCIPPYVEWEESYSIYSSRASAFKIATWPWVKETKR